MLEKATGKKFLSHALLGFLKGCVIRTNLMKMELDNIASKTILHRQYIKIIGRNRTISKTKIVPAIPQSWKKKEK